MTRQETRYKVMFYLSSETYRADDYAKAVLTAAPHGERNRLQRAAMLAGLAMHKIDPRIPYLLAELLNADTGPEEMLQVINAALPRSGQLSGGRTQEASKPAEPATAVADTTEPDAAAKTRDNAKGMFKGAGA